MNDLSDEQPASTLTVLAQAALMLGQGVGEKTLFNVVLNGVAAVCSAGWAALLAPGEDEGQWRVLAATGAAAHEFDKPPLPAVVRVWADGKPHIDEAADQSARVLALPLRSGGRALGVIVAGQIGVHVGEAELPALQALANQAAVALERADFATSLAAAEQARREYVSLTTHQLRVPLTSLSGYTDLMLSGMAGSLNERQEGFMRTIRRNADRMALLIADLSDLNRIEDGRMPLQIYPFDVGTLINSVVAEQTALIASRGHVLRCQVPDDLPPASGDRSAVKRIFEKILANAVLYTPEGGAIVAAAAGQGDMVQVTVTDNGIGISPDDQARLFTPFFRSEDEAVRAHTGWGLSLALAKALIEAQGGRLWYESEAGEGCAFHFTLPVAGTKAR